MRWRHPGTKATTRRGTMPAASDARPRRRFGRRRGSPERCPSARAPGRGPRGDRRKMRREDRHGARELGNPAAARLGCRSTGPRGGRFLRSGRRTFSGFREFRYRTGQLERFLCGGCGRSPTRRNVALNRCYQEDAVFFPAARSCSSSAAASLASGIASRPSIVTIPNLPPLGFRTNFGDVNETLTFPPVRSLG